MSSASSHTVSIEDLFRLNYRPLCMYALHYLQDADLVEDVVFPNGSMHMRDGTGGKAAG